MSQFGEIVAHFFQQGHGVLPAGIIQHDEEFFPAIAADEVAFSQALREQPRKTLDHAIARQVSIWCAITLTILYIST